MTSELAAPAHNEAMTDKQFTIMAVHAHPDDEATSTGGILARYASEGVRTVVVTCTGGELGEIADPSMASPENLADVRRRELDDAASILGVSQIYMLGYRDSGMAGLPENQAPGSFWSADLDEATNRLVELVRRERPHVLVTYDENGFYGHPDHIQANRVTVAAWEAAGDSNRYPDQGLEPWTPRKLYFTAIPRSNWRKFPERIRAAGIELPETDEEQDWGTPDELVTSRLDVSKWVALKREALMAHKTQMGANVIFSMMPPWLFDELFGTEAFVRVGCRVDAPEREDDLLAGLRA
jgi:mycothiol conjugate amidase Mca